MPEVLLGQLGLIPYDQAMALEDGLRRQRYAGGLPDIILIMEHPPTVTLGRFGKSEHLLASREELAKRGIAFFNSDRGGDATFHAPGQLVLHVVMDIRRRQGLLRGFITDLEEVVIHMLASYGVVAERWSEHPGLWIDGRQMGAIGLHLGHGITSHGLALNIDPELSSFGVINLCGLPGREATSLARELGHSVDIKQAAQKLVGSFATVFQVKPVSVTGSYLAERAAMAATSPCHGSTS